MRKSKVFESDRNNRTVRDVKEERDTGYARLRSFGGKHSYMEMFWKMNDEAAEDQVIKLKIGDQTAFIHWEELLRYGRWV